MDLSQNILTAGNIAPEVEIINNPPEQDFFNSFWTRLGSLNNTENDISENSYLINPSNAMMNILSPLLEAFPIPDSPPQPRRRRQFRTGMTYRGLQHIVSDTNTNRRLFTSSGQWNDIMETSFNEKPKYKRIISSTGLENIKYKLYEPTNPNKICPITREEFTVDEEIAELPCKHSFNKEAILMWLKKKSANCPICRHQMDWVEEEDKIKTEAPQQNRITSHPGLTNIITNIFNERLEQEDNENMQRAIIASLQRN